MKNSLWKQKKHRSQGFTVLETMTAVVIIGILVAIVASNFIASSKKRALEASLSTNMRTLQVMLETYRVDWSSYPDTLAELGVAATQKNYNKSANNPYTKRSGPVGSSNTWATECYDPASPPVDPAIKQTYVGMVCYVPVGVGTHTKYYLMGYDDNAVPIQKNNTIYLVTNG